MSLRDAVGGEAISSLVGAHIVPVLFREYIVPVFLRDTAPVFLFLLFYGQFQCQRFKFWYLIDLDKLLHKHSNRLINTHLEGDTAYLGWI